MTGFDVHAALTTPPLFCVQTQQLAKLGLKHLPRSWMQIHTSPSRRLWTDTWSWYKQRRQHNKFPGPSFVVGAHGTTTEQIGPDGFSPVSWDQIRNGPRIYHRPLLLLRTNVLNPCQCTDCCWPFPSIATKRKKEKEKKKENRKKRAKGKKESKRKEKKRFPGPRELQLDEGGLLRLAEHLTQSLFHGFLVLESRP